ncbi:MAG: hypothetical protein Q9185_002247 [Variospora sp. 1 TL-2023]
MAAAKTETQYDLMSLYGTNLIRVERTLVALDSYTAMSSETNAQGLAEQVLRLNQAAKASSARVLLSLNFKMHIVKATLTTREDWRQEILHRPKGSVMDAEILDRGLLIYTKMFTDNDSSQCATVSKELKSRDHDH